MITVMCLPPSLCWIDFLSVSFADFHLDDQALNMSLKAFHLIFITASCVLASFWIWN